MVHTRLNESGTNPNPHINFVTALPVANSAYQEEARQLLCALAAQARPLMKAHGFSVNSLEEYEHNSVFLGRNWNNGETIELVLRRRDGLFMPTSSLMATFCHELAHIKHMNHGFEFQALWKELCRDVRNLQSKGYYGDGQYFHPTPSEAISSPLAPPPHTKSTNGEVSGAGIQPGDFPKYMCGGAQSRARPTALRRRKRREPGPSLHTGAQTSRKRKAGVRVTNVNSFTGSGTTLNSGEADDTKGTGFRRQAASKRAREERALAAERRIRALKAQAQGELTPSTAAADESNSSPKEESDSEGEVVRETDQDRLRMLLDTVEDGDLDGMKGAWIAFDDDFEFNIKTSKTTPSSARNQKDETNAVGCDLLQSSSSGSTFTATAPALSGSRTRDGKGKEKAIDASTNISHRHIDTHPPLDSTSRKVSNPSSKRGLGLRRLVQTEIDFRKKESLGLLPTHSNRKLGAGTTSNKSSGRATGVGSRKGEESEVKDVSRTLGQQWSCLVCTMSNNAEHLACSACATPQGESVWVGDHDSNRLLANE